MGLKIGRKVLKVNCNGNVIYYELSILRMNGKNFPIHYSCRRIGRFKILQALFFKNA